MVRCAATAATRRDALAHLARLHFRPCSLHTPGTRKARCLLPAPSNLLCRRLNAAVRKRVPIFCATSGRALLDARGSRECAWSIAAQHAFRGAPRPHARHGNRTEHDRRLGLAATLWLCACRLALAVLLRCSRTDASTRLSCLHTPDPDEGHLLPDVCMPVGQ